ncbi:MAG: AI-2E family transporter [Gluconacetobacter diazotrophicus]|nr:AI-2E family transporter [Gluconacetobacter diazotrophicus]
MAEEAETIARTVPPVPVVENTDARRLRSQQVARGVLAGILVLLGFVTLRDFLPSLAWAVIFAIATWPLYQRARRRWPPTGHDLLLPTLFTAVIALVFLVPLILVGLEVAREAQGVLAWVNHARQTGVPVPNWMHKLPLGRDTATAWWQEHLANPDDASDLFESMKASGNLQVTRQVGSQVLHRSTLFVFTIVTLFFLFREGDRVVEQMLVASRRAFGKRGEHIGRQVIASVHGTVDGLVLVGLGEGLLLGIAYGVAGAPHPPLFGALTAVAAMIPFGAVIAIGAASLLVAGKGAMIVGIALFVFGLLVIFIADHFVRPVLIGGATKLPFLWVLLGILGGVEEWGLLGLFLGPAIMAALILLWRDWTRPRPSPDDRAA